MAGNNDNNSIAPIELDGRAIKNIFATIKKNGILDKPLRYYRKMQDSIDLPQSNEFIDYIKYYRLLNDISKRQLCKNIGIDEETYRQYELKNFEIQDVELAERMLSVLGIEDVLELPNYFKIMKKYSLEDIKNIILNYGGKKEFSEVTGISRSIINHWYQKSAPKKLSTYTYKKLVCFFDKYNIKY